MEIKLQKIELPLSVTLNIQRGIFIWVYGVLYSKAKENPDWIVKITAEELSNLLQRNKTAISTSIRTLKHIGFIRQVAKSTYKVFEEPSPEYNKPKSVQERLLEELDVLEEEYHDKKEIKILISFAREKVVNSQDRFTSDISNLINILKDADSFGEEE